MLAFFLLPRILARVLFSIFDPNFSLRSLISLQNLLGTLQVLDKFPRVLDAEAGVGAWLREGETDDGGWMMGWSLYVMFAGWVLGSEE